MLEPCILHICYPLLREACGTFHVLTGIVDIASYEEKELSTRRCDVEDADEVSRVLGRVAAVNYLWHRWSRFAFFPLFSDYKHVSRHGTR